MIRNLAVALIAFLIPGCATAVQGSGDHKLLSAWVQTAPGGFDEARAVVAGKSCPEIRINRATFPMGLRAPATLAFPNLLCAATLPPAAISAAISGRDLPLPHARADRIVVFGDTGCRIKGYAVQACN